MTFLIKIIDFQQCNVESDQISSVESLEALIARIDSLVVCEGASGLSMNSESENLLRSFSYTAKIDVIRYKNCSIILPETTGDKKSNRSCGCCKSVKTLLRKKIIRLQQTKKVNYLKISELSPKKQQKIKAMMRKVKTKSRGKQRADT